jgi:predicted transcriptional regulator
MLIEQIPVKKIADRLKISETAVYKNINEGNLELVMELKHRIDKAVGGVLQ